MAEVAFIAAVRKIFDAHGNKLIINCVHASMQMRHLADSLSCDSAGMNGHCSVVDGLVHHSSGRPSLLLRNIIPQLTSASIVKVQLPGVTLGTVRSLSFLFLFHR